MRATTLFLDRALLPAGWRQNVTIRFEGRLISAVVPDSVAPTEAERHAIGVPGLANLHSHAFQRAMAGQSELPTPGPDNFWTWREKMYGVALAIDPDQAEAVAAMLYAEMLEAGFTRVGEFHYLHHDKDGTPYGDPGEMAGRMLSAATATGIGMTLLPVFYAHGGIGGRPFAPAQRRFISDLPLFARIMERSRALTSAIKGARIGVAPHSLRAVTADELREVIGLAEDGEPIHMHVAEQVQEVEDSMENSGARPVEWLLSHATVDSRWCLIHATHMTEAETRDLAATGAVVGLCPQTEANLGDGIFNGRRFVKQRGRFGIGTDSNVSVDPAHELRQLEYAQRLAWRRRNVLVVGDGRSTGRYLFDTALAGGSQALATRDCGLEAGAIADLVTFREDHPSMVGLDGDALLDAWIFSADRSVIDNVWAAGRKCVDGGLHHRRETLERAYATTLLKLITQD
ncbi:MAG: formimidoylglutamate deiminase [Bauldia sp.]|nr:formimidoylglutamate deiminase [Bauldia sp.]